MNIDDFLLIGFAVVVACILIAGAVYYAGRSAEEEVVKEAEKRNSPQVVFESREYVRFSVFESIKLGFGFGIGLALAGFAGILFGALTFGSIIYSLVSTLR